MEPTVTASQEQSSRRQFLELLLVSSAGLYLEMLVIRWLAAEIRLFSYFKNFSLIGAFLGLSLGFAMARRPGELWKRFHILILAYVVGVVIVGRQTGFGALVVPESGEYIWRTAALPPLIATAVFGLLLLLFFSLTVALFVPLGQLTGRLMIGLPPLPAYMVNLLGSLAGIAIFAGVAFLNLEPWHWYAGGLVPLLWFVRRERRSLAVAVISLAVLLVLLAASNGSTVWSPYYRIDIAPFEIASPSTGQRQAVGYDLSVNKISHMFAINLAPDYIAAYPEIAERLRTFATVYDLPYLLTDPGSVLIVGAGMGNDVAAARRHGVPQIDAVEIDPLILSLGRQLHPERPYQSEEVRVIVDDARAYFERAEARYDLIVFGVLDSQTLLSGMSSVRLDNYVYTVESLEQARDHLTENGVIALTFDAEAWWVKQRLADTLERVFQAPPVQLAITGTPWTVYISGGGLLRDPVAVCREVGTCEVEDPLHVEPISLATDDWPYLYLRERSFPTPYAIALGVVLLIAWIATRKTFGSAKAVSPQFFLLGAGFLLIEFRIITELALLFGSTWLVNAIAVAAVLAMVLLANVVVSRLRQVDFRLLYLLLLATIALGYLLPVRALLTLPILPRVAAAWLVMGMPVFFSSAIFSALLRRASGVPEALSSNLLGSVAGGMLEYGSLAFGIKSLYLMGAALYLGSWIAGGWHARRAA